MAEQLSIILLTSLAMAGLAVWIGGTSKSKCACGKKSDCDSECQSAKGMHSD